MTNRGGEALAFCSPAEALGELVKSEVARLTPILKAASAK